MKIAFVGPYDTKNKSSSWPGTRAFMSRYLEKHCGNVDHIGPIRSGLETVGRAISLTLRLSTGRYYDYKHSILLSKILGRKLKQRLSGHSYDILFVPAASTEAAFLEGCPPIIYTSDATYAAIRSYYPLYKRTMGKSVQEANIVEGLTISKAGLNLYPSEWARQSAIIDYHADPGKVHVIPYGANLDEESVPSRETVLKRRRSDRCRLLFIGMDWHRKGGDIAFDTLQELERMGIPAELTVCGCTPPEQVRHENLIVIPHLDKSVEAERREFADILLSSDFLLLPTRGDCYGIVFCEASAFGVPSIATRTGGVPGAVTEGENGYLLPLEAGAHEYAELIRDIYEDHSRHTELSASAREAFESRLNWDAWAKSVRELMMKCVR